MTKALVSVILPSLNVVDYIEETITSVINQTLKEIEIICVDAGSTDGTLEIINKYKEIDPRVKLIITDYKSYGYQVNTGINESQADYVAIVETDDYIAPNMYERLYFEAIRNDCDFVKCNYYTFWTQSDGSHFLQKRYNLPSNMSYNVLIENPVVKDICINDLYLWDGIYKKSYMLENNIAFSETPGAAFQDVSFLFQVSIFCKRVMYVEDAYYFYRIDREGSSINSDKAFLFSFTEYSLMYAKYRSLIQNNIDVSKTFFCRITLAFYNTLTDIVREHNYCVKPYYDWFCNMIQFAIEQKIISDDDMPIDRTIASMLVPFEDYMAAHKERLEIVKSFIESNCESPTIVFGCGNFGIYIYRWLKTKEYEVAYFIDNDDSKWEKCIDGIKIINPQEIVGFDKRTNYIVASNLYSDAMKKQLYELGVPKDKICVI